MNVIVAFPKPEIAKNIRNVLVKSGYEVQAVCTTGGQVLQNMNMLEYGMLVCGYRFTDMMYDEIAEYMPEGFEMLLVASQRVWNENSKKNIVCLAMPIKVHELISTVEMMSYSIQRRRKKAKSKPKVRSREETELIEQAKLLLMERNNLSEEEAHRYIQKSSMDSGNSFTETAQMIMSMMG